MLSELNWTERALWNQVWRGGDLDQGAGTGCFISSLLTKLLMVRPKSGTLRWDLGPVPAWDQSWGYENSWIQEQILRSLYSKSWIKPCFSKILCPDVWSYSFFFLSVKILFLFVSKNLGWRSLLDWNKKSWGGTPSTRGGQPILLKLQGYFDEFHQRELSCRFIEEVIVGRGAHLHLKRVHLKRESWKLQPSLDLLGTSVGHTLFTFRREWLCSESPNFSSQSSRLMHQSEYLRKAILNVRLCLTYIFNQNTC